MHCANVTSACSKSRYSSALVSGIVALVLAFSAFAFVGANEAQAASPSIDVTRVSTGKLVMAKGVKYKLAAKASTGKLAYKSSKPKVVKVSTKGQLKAKKPGKAVITVKVKGTKASKKLKVKVVKKSKFKKVKKLAASVAKARLSVGQSTKVTVSFTPKKPSNANLLFSSSYPAVASVASDGTVKAKKPGSARIAVQSCDNAKAKAVATIVVAAPRAPSDDAVTRAEFAADLCDAMGLDTLADKDISPYKDINATKQAGAIRALWVQGAFGSDDEASFNPNAKATRLFAATSAVRALGYEEDDSELYCEDVYEVDWRDEANLAIALDEGLVELSSGKLLPDQAITRSAEKALIAKVRSLLEVGDGKYRCQIDYADGVFIGEADLKYGDYEVIATMDAVPDGLEVGGVLVVDPSDENPFGAALRVTDIEGNTVTGEQIEDIDEVLDNIVVSSGEISAAKGALFFPEEGIDVVDSGGSSKHSLMSAQAYEAEIGNDRASFKFKDDGSLTAKLKIVDEEVGSDTFDESKGEVNVAATIKPKVVPDINLMRGKFNVKLSTNLDFSVEGKISRDKRIRLGRAYIPLPGGFAVLADLNIHLRVDGSAQLTFSAVDVATLKVGKHCSFTNKLSRPDVSFSVEANAKLGPEVDFTIGWHCIQLYDLGFEGGVAASGVETRRSSGMVCTDLDAWLYFEVFAGRHCTKVVDRIRDLFPNMPECKWEWEIVGADETPGTLVETPWKKHWHLEDLKPVPKCTWADAPDDPGEGGSGGDDSDESDDPNAVDLSDASPGDRVTFGKYFQSEVQDSALIDKLDRAELREVSGIECYEVAGVRYAYVRNYDAYFKEKPVSWYVIGEEGDNLVLISEKVLDWSCFFSGTADELFWGTCDLRDWLNGPFFKFVFSADEQNRIQSSDVSYTEQTWEMWDAGLPPRTCYSTDKVYLLSDEDVESGVLSNAGVSAIAQATPYADINENDCRWWLRGETFWHIGNLRTNYVDEDGEIAAWYPTYSRGVRPVIKVSK